MDARDKSAEPVGEWRLAVLGLGYVGLPLAVEAARAGIPVIGFDISDGVVHSLNSGVSHVDDISDAAVQELLRFGFTATASRGQLANANAYVITVPTPLSPEGGPDLTAVRSAATTVAGVITAGDLVVLESTTYPGTTEEIVAPILETSGLLAGKDFHLAFSPERIDPGNATYGLRNTPKIVGGVDEASYQAAAALYSQTCDVVVQAAGTREAELAKLLENTYRHVNIALVNEMAQFSHELNIDLWDAIRCASTKPFGFQAFYPGPGVGGHCIPIDPNYLSFRVRSELGHAFRFVELAQEINSSMPAYVAHRVMLALNRRGLPINGARVLLLGVTYKANIADVRESPARPLARRLKELGAQLSYWDPYVDNWAVEGPIERVASLVGVGDFDCVVVLQAHDELDQDVLEAHCELVLDTRSVVAGAENL